MIAGVVSYVVRFLVPAVFTLQEIFLVFISVRGQVNPTPQRGWKDYFNEKIKMIPSGVEPATFRFVAQCLNQMRYRVTKQTDCHIRCKIIQAVLCTVTTLVCHLITHLHPLSIEAHSS